MIHPEKSNETVKTSRPRCVVVMHSVLNLKFFWIPILRAMAEEFDVTLYIRNDVPEILEKLDLPCRVVLMPIERKVAPFRDLSAAYLIWRQLRHDKPHLLQTVTPKAGLLGMLAGRLAGVPIRIHTYQGQVWATAKGIKRQLFRIVDKLIGELSTSVLADSKTQLEFLHNERVLRQDVGQVLGSGSISGVDITRFERQMVPDQELRAELGLSEGAFVFLYMGRLQRDKGLHVLAEAYANVRTRTAHPTRLVVVGPDEDNLGAMLQEMLGEEVVLRPYSSQPEAYMRLAHAAVLPSFREGFGTSLIEAAAMGLPAVASRIYGIDCAVVDGQTGLLFDVGNPKQMADAMLRLVEDPEEYHRLSEAAHARVKSEFDQRIVIAKLMEYYRVTLATKGHRA